MGEVRAGLVRGQEEQGSPSCPQGGHRQVEAATAPSPRGGGGAKKVAVGREGHRSFREDLPWEGSLKGSHREGCVKQRLRVTAQWEGKGASLSGWVTVEGVRGYGVPVL